MGRIRRFLPLKRAPLGNGAAMSLRIWLILAALVFSFILRTIREWITHDRTLAETFSSWEWASNFLLYWIISFIAVSVVFIGLDMLRVKAKGADSTH